MSRRTRAILSCVLCCAAAAAQQSRPASDGPRRGTFVATVTGPDCRPLAGASVTCVTSPGLLTFGHSEVVTATTDAHGRARCELRIGLLYVAWAVGPAGGDGTSSVSEPIQLVAAGRVADLSAWARGASRHLQLNGHEAWRAAGATALRWYPVAGNAVTADLPLTADGTVLLPASPWGTGCLAFVDRDGETLVTVAVPSGSTEVPPLPQPVRFGVTVVDVGGAPVPGATISHIVPVQSAYFAGLFGYTTAVQPWLRRAATTDAAGKASLYAPAPRRREDDVILHASKPGFVTTSVVATADTRVKLDRATQTRVRVLGAGDARLTLGAICGFVVETAQRTTCGRLPLAAEAVDATHWLVDAPASGFSPRLWLERGAVPTAIVLDGGTSEGADGMTLDVGKLQRADVQVIGADGGPPACALAVARVAEGFPVYWEQIVAPDTAGRATLLLPDDEFFVYATSGSAHALELVDRGPRAPLTLRLEPLPTMLIRVEDVQGKPVAGARAQPSSGHGGGRVVDAKARQWSRVASELGNSYAALPSSGADGMLSVPVFLTAGMGLDVVVRAGTRSAYVTLAAGGERKVVVR